MGVNGLWKLLQPVCRRIDVDTLRGKTVAVDVSVWLYQFVKAMRDKEDGRMTKNAPLIGALRRILKLLSSKVKPLFVFDGVAPELKGRIMNKRRSQMEHNAQRRTKAAEKLLLNQLLLAKLNGQQKNSVKDKPKFVLSSEQQKKVIPGATKRLLVLDESSSDSDDDVEDFPLGITWKKKSNPPEVAETKGKPMSKSAKLVYAPKEEEKEETEEQQYKERLQLVEDIISQMPKTSSGGGYNTDSLRNFPVVIRHMVIKRLEERNPSRDSKRNELIPVANNAEKYSTLQVSHFIKDAQFKKKLRNMKTTLSGESGSGRRIASDSRVQYVLTEINTGAQVSSTARAVHSPALSAVANSLGKAKPSESKSSAANLLNRLLSEKGNTNAASYRAQLSKANARHKHQTKSTSQNTKRHSITQHIPSGGTMSVAGDKVVFAFSKSDLEVKNSSKLFPKEILDSFVVPKGGVKPRRVASPVSKEDFVNDSNSQKGNMESVFSSALDTAAGLAPWGAVAVRNAIKKREKMLPGNMATTPGKPDRSSNNMVVIEDDTPPKNWLDDDDSDDELNSIQARQQRIVGKVKSKVTPVKQQKKPLSKRRVEYTLSDDDDDDESDYEPQLLANGSLSKPANQGSSLQKPTTQERNSSASRSIGVQEKKASQPVVIPLLENDNEDEQEKSQAVRQVLLEGQARRPSHHQEYTPSQTESSNRVVQCHTSTQPSPHSDSIISASSSGSIIQSGLQTQGLQPSSTTSSSTAPISGPTTQVLPRSSSIASSTSASSRSSSTALSERSNFFSRTSASNVVKPVDDINVRQIASVAKAKAQGLPRSNSNTSTPPGARRSNVGSHTANTNSHLVNSINLQNSSLITQRNLAQRDADTVTPEMISQVKQMLEVFGLPYVEAPSEAEAQCAALEIGGLVDGVVTDDCDVFLFGGRNIYRNIFSDKKYVEEYRMNEIENEISMDRDVLIQLAVLLGSDYTPGITGIGPVNALEVIEAFDSLEEFSTWAHDPTRGQGAKRKRKKVAKKKQKRKKGKKKKREGESSSDGESDESDDEDGRSDTESSKVWFKRTKGRNNWVVPDNLGPKLEQIRKAYMNPAVSRFDPARDRLEWKKPDYNMIEMFLSRTLGWDTERIKREVDEPLRLYAERTVQLSLDSFVVRYESGTRDYAIKSERLKRAIHGLRKKKNAKGQAPKFVNSIGFADNETEKTQSKDNNRKRKK